MALILNNSSYTRAFLMVYSSDHLTGGTNLTVTVNISKAGGAFAPAAGSVSAVGAGIYTVALTGVDTNTLGDLAYWCTGTNVDTTNFVDQIVAANLNALNVTAGTLSGTVQLTSGTYAVNLGGSINNVVLPVNITGGTISAVTGSVGSVVGAVGSVTGAVGSVTGSVGSVTNPVNITGGTISAVSGAVGSVSGNVVGSVNSVTTPVSLASGTYAANLTGSVNNVVSNVNIASQQIFVKKNAVLNGLMFMMVRSSDHVTPITGATVNTSVSINGAAFAPTVNTASEIGQGVYTINLAAADTNGNTLMFLMSGTSCDNRYMEIITQT